MNERKGNQFIFILFSFCNGLLELIKLVYSRRFLFY